MTIQIQKALDILSRHGHLSAEEAEAVMQQIMSGGATDGQIGAYLMALRMKGETHDEIIGSARAMRAHAQRVPTRYTGDQLLDTCGTGGDKSNTFNISTTVAFVAAGAGVPVAKHGNRAATSKSGSADVLNALGVNIDLTAEQVGQCVDQVGIGFLFAAKLHPAMKYAIGVRRELAVRTMFNILGPLTNPAGAQRQLMGVFAADLAPFLADVLGALGAVSAVVVCGYGEVDELTTVGANTISHYRDGAVNTYTLHPQELGFKTAGIDDLLGGEPTHNAEITRGILGGQVGDARRDVVLLNAAAALLAAGRVGTLSDGVPLAAQTIDSGAAARTLQHLVDFSQSIATQ
jgi:anthranilate phosphoribosyltransferase